MSRRVLVLLVACSLVQAEKITLLHRFYHPQLPELPFTERGTIDISTRLLDVTESYSRDLTEFGELFESLESAPSGLGLYQVGIKTGEVLDISSVKACHVGGEHSIVLHARENAPFAIDYLVSPPPSNARCPKKAFHIFAAKNPTNLTTSVRYAHVPPLPELRTPPPLTPQGEPVKPEPEKSFLAKYWIYIAAVVIALMMSGGAPEQEEQNLAAGWMVQDTDDNAGAGHSSLLATIKSPNVPLPVSLFWYSCSSTLVAFILLPVSLLDLGVLSYYINPPVTIFTILYHGFVLVVSQRPRKPDHPTYYASAILFAFLLDVAWIVAFITTTVVCATKQQDPFYSVQYLRSKGLPVSLDTQRFQVFLTLLLAILTGGMAVTGYRIAQREGEPDSWRPEGLDRYYDDVEKA